MSKALNGEAVYGTVLTAGLISAFSVYDPSVAALTTQTVGTVVVFWAAHIYAEIVGNRDATWRDAFLEAIQRSAGLLWALIVPVLCLTAAALLRLPTTAAVDVALWGAVVMLAVLGWWAARQRKAALHIRIIAALATAAMGLALIALKALVH